ncbi:hypothetical protein ACTXT7_008498 [Hymenolepis weldensis]
MDVHAALAIKKVSLDKIPIGPIYRGHIDRIDKISQVTHVVRSVRRMQASHPNLLIGKLGLYTKDFSVRRQSCLVVGVSV